MNIINLLSSITLFTFLVVGPAHAGFLDDLITIIDEVEKTPGATQINNTPEVDQKPKVKAYDLDEIIARTPGYLDDKFSKLITYDGDAKRAFDEDRTSQFNFDTFGKCTEFHIDFRSPNRTWAGQAGHGLFFFVLDQQFRRSEKSNLIDTSMDKEEFKSFVNKKLDELGGTCNESKQSIARLIFLMNAIIPAANAAVAKQYEKNEVAAAKSREFYATLEKEDKVRQEKIEITRKCQQTNQYLLFSTADKIVESKTRARAIEEIMDREKKAARISGFVDKDLMYKNGKSLAQLDEDISKHFTNYKKLGGKANKPSAVVKLNDPCVHQL